jgi:4a-hydroxytetrahydrobiopterin dehydratase
MTDLSTKSCAACEGWVPPLSEDDLARHKAQLNLGWVIDTEKQCLTRKFAFKAFARAVYTANLVAYICDKEGHHADVAFGWGYCHVSFTSHELGHLSDNDFICATKLDAVV